MENLPNDELTRWQALFCDPEIVGPVFVLNNQQWRVDMRSRTILNAFKTSRLGATGTLKQIEVPSAIVTAILNEDLINLSRGVKDE